MTALAIGVSDEALPAVLVAGAFGIAVAGGVTALAVSQWISAGASWIAGRLSGLPVLIALYGCDDCGVGVGELHRYSGCPGNVRLVKASIAERLDGDHDRL